MEKTDDAFRLEFPIHFQHFDCTKRRSRGSGGGCGVLFLSFQCIDVCTSPFTNATVRNGHRTGASQDEMQFSNCLFCVSFRTTHVRLYLDCVYGVVAPFQVNDCLFTINGRSNRQRHTHTQFEGTMQRRNGSIKRY